jgi:Lhr-like helicase
MLADGFTTRRGRRGALIHRDAVHQMLRARRGARTTALTSGGTIPDTADYQVLLEPDNHIIGSVNEDFAVESMAGDVFQLGNTSYRILRVERGTVRVARPAAQYTLLARRGAGPQRRAFSFCLAAAHLGGRLRSDPSGKAARPWLTELVGISAPASEQLIDYLAAGAAAFGCLPTQDTTGMELVIHAPFGSRINRAWGLALRNSISNCSRPRPKTISYCHRIVADYGAQFRIAGRRALSAPPTRASLADPSHARRPDVHHPVALGGESGSCSAEISRRQESAAPVHAHAGGRPHRHDISRSDRVRGEFGG